VPVTLAALHVTKCRLCGQPQGGSVGLCNDCSRALTRAQQGSAALRDAPPDARRKPRVVDRIVLTSSSSQETSPQPRSRPRVALWATLGVVVVVTALAFVGKPTRPAEPKPVEHTPRAVTPLLEPAVSDVTEVDPVVVPLPKAAATAEAPATPIVAPHGREPKATRAAPAKSAAMRSDTDTKPAGDASRMQVAPPPPEPEPPVQQARVNTAPASVISDDPQALSSALAKCSGEKFLAAVICEQKARLAYCEGKWGMTPQCTAKPRVD